MNVNGVIKRPVLRYHGGKFILARWILSHFPPHRIYTEPFGGAGSILMQKPRSYAEIYNDKWDTVVNVFKVLRNKKKAAELERQLRLTPFSRTEFNGCGEVDLSEITDSIEKARRTILRSFCGFGSASANAKHATGFRANSNRSGTTPAHDWVNYPNHIQSFVNRLQGVIIENRDYRDAIASHDSSSTLHYLDPPYVQSTRNLKRGNALYEFEMSDQEHIEMSIFVKSTKGMVVISGYGCDLYDELFKGWHKVTKSSLADGAKERIECLWMNKSVVKALPPLFHGGLSSSKAS